MARPAKKGIDYFSFDVDFFEDEKIEPISGEFGIKGEIIAIRLLCAVYRNGYFAMWNEQLKMTLANRCKVSSDLIEQVISRLVKWGFIDEHLFNSAKVITSKGIQKRFQEATRKRKYSYSEFDFWLLNDEKGVSGGNNSLKREFRAEETPQSKVNKSNIYIIGSEEFFIASIYLSQLEEMINDLVFLEPICMNMKIDIDSAKDWVKRYYVKLTNEGASEIKPINEYRQHFANWLRTKLEEQKKQKGGINANNRTGFKPDSKEKDYSTTF